MPEAQQTEITSFLELYVTRGNAVHHARQCEMACLAKGIAMQQAGVVEMDNDPDRIYDVIQGMDTASLR